MRKAGINKVGTASLGCRITVEGKSTPVFSTGVRVRPKDWDAKKQKIKLKDAVSVLDQEELDAIVARLKAIRLDFENKGKEYSAISIKAHFDGAGAKSERTFANLIAEFTEITERMPNKETSKGKLCIIAKISKYAKANNFLNLLLAEIKPSFFEKMLIDLKRVGDIAGARIARHLSYCKAMFTLAQKLGYIDKNPSEFVKAEKFKEKKLIFLEPAEIKAIEDEVFIPELMQTVRDMFVLCIYTGLAFKDLSLLCSEDVVIGVDGRNWLRLERSKSDGKTRLPILEKAQAIIDKYGIDDLPTKTIKCHNEYLKHIQKACKITKTLSTHIARKTFCVMALNEWNVPLETVSVMAGHADTKTTMMYYTTVLDKKVAHDMKNIK